MYQYYHPMIVDEPAPTPDSVAGPGLSSRLRELFDGLGKREKDVAREILRDYPISALTTVATLAERSGVSTATVLRLIQRLDFDGYGAFQESVKRDLNRLLQSPAARHAAPRDEGTSDGFAERMFRDVGGGLATCVGAILESDFQDVVGMLADGRRPVFCIGGRYGRHVAELLADYLGVLRADVRFVDGQADSWARHLLDVGPRSLVIIVDIRRYQRTIRRFSEHAQNRGATVIAITDLWATHDQVAADYFFRLPTASPSLMDSLTGPLLLAEALVGGLAQRLGTTVEQRLVDCEALDCLEGDLRVAWPGTTNDDQ